MEIYKIKSLDCSIKSNRKVLLKEIMKAVKVDEKPSEERLEKIAYVIGEKYNMKIKIVKCVRSGMFISYKYEDDAYCTFTSRTYYEALCKYILLVRKHIKNRSMEVK